MSLILILFSCSPTKLKKLKKTSSKFTMSPTNTHKIQFFNLYTNESCPSPDQKELETLTESDINEKIEPIVVPDPNIKQFKVFTNPLNAYSFLPLDEEFNKINFASNTYEKEKETKKDKHLGKKRQRKIRKYKPDDIRKKIKARFHKTLKNIINYKLKKAGSTLFFDFLPQSFISNISKLKNRKLLNLTYYELLQNNFIKELDIRKYQKKDVDETKYQNNLNMLRYLDMHPEISQTSGFDVIAQMKYIDILNEYFSSAEYKYSIVSLKEENEDLAYIKEYQAKAKGYINFFVCKE